MGILIYKIVKTPCSLINNDQDFDIKHHAVPTSYIQDLQELNSHIFHDVIFFRKTLATSRKGLAIKYIFISLQNVPIIHISDSH